MANTMEQELIAIVRYALLRESVVSGITNNALCFETLRVLCMHDTRLVSANYCNDVGRTTPPTKNEPEYNPVLLYEA